MNLNSGYKITGSLSITGGGGDDIKFWITDPEGSTILNLGIVSKGTSFGFTASKNGAYTLHFDNNFSLFSSKVVTVTYNTDMGSVITSGIPSYPFESIGLGIILSVILIVHISNRNKNNF